MTDTDMFRLMINHIIPNLVASIVLLVGLIAQDSFLVFASFVIFVAYFLTSLSDSYGKKGKHMQNKLTIKVRTMSDKAHIPTKAHDDDAGFDLYASSGLQVLPGSIGIVHTDISLELPEGYFAKLFDRSGNAAKRGYHVMAGVIDNGYRGEVMVVVYNYSGNVVNIAEYDRVAQMVLFKNNDAKIEQADNLGESARAEKGFGSSGK